MQKYIPFILIFFLGCAKLYSQNAGTVTIDLHGPVKETGHYWASTGFAPAENVLREDVQMNIDYIGSIANHGIRYIRPHYLLNLVEIRNFNHPDEQIVYTRLDSVLDVFHRNDLRPVFEVMGNPSDVFTDYGDSLQIRKWKEFITDLALHLIDRYGRDEVRSWYFETINEPNWKGWWDQGFERFNYYYDATSEGLKAADPELRFGGPGTWEVVPCIFKTMLDHCDDGVNYFSGERGSRLDFISVHVKKLPKGMIADEKTYIDYIREKHPDFAQRPFFNDEADPVVGWGIRYWWRAGSYYSAFVAQSVDYHNRFLIDSLGVNYGLLSNDNGFVGTWGQRTLLAKSGEDPDRFFFVRKPVINTMSLLSLLGEKRIILNENHLPENAGIIATERKNGDLAILLYNKPDFDFSDYIDFSDPTPEMHQRDSILGMVNDQATDILLKLPADAAGKILVHYRLDEEHANPYQQWLDLDSPENPSLEQVSLIREHEYPAVIEGPVKLDRTNLNIHLPAPSVSLILIASDDRISPSVVEGLHFRKYTGLNKEDMIMLQWDDLRPAEDILRYEVFFRETSDKRFTKISPGNLVDHGYVFITNKGESQGRYKVRAVNYSGRKGRFSNVLTVGAHDRAPGN